MLSCRKELTAEARELKGDLYCLPCHDKMGVPICGACRRPIEGRVVNALGKQWHVEVSEAGSDRRGCPWLLVTVGSGAAAPPNSHPQADAAPPHPGLALAYPREPGGLSPDHRQAAMPTLLLPLPDLVEDSKVTRKP